MAGNVTTSSEALGGIPTGDYYYDGTDLWIQTNRGLERITDVGSSTFTSPTITSPTVTGGTITSSTIVTPTITGNITGSSGTAAGAGLLSTGAGAPSINVVKVNNEIITSIQVDLQGLASKNTDLDVIGLAAGGAAYVTQVTTAINGIIHRCEMTCVELPTASANPMIDINLATSTAATGVYDDGGAGLAGYALILNANGNFAAGLTKESALGTNPAANSYIYLLSGATPGGDATFTGGQFVIKLYGYAVR